MTCETCRDLLNEALNLACRSDQFEEQRRRQAALDVSIDPEAWQKGGLFDAYVAEHNEMFPHSQIAPKCLTMHLWVQDQYDKDLADWQARAREHLMKEHHP